MPPVHPRYKFTRNGRLWDLGCRCGRTNARRYMPKAGCQLQCNGCGWLVEVISSNWAERGVWGWWYPQLDFDPWPEGTQPAMEPIEEEPEEVAEAPGKKEEPSKKGGSSKESPGQTPERSEDPSKEEAERKKGKSKWKGKEKVRWA